METDSLWTLCYACFVVGVGCCLTRLHRQRLPLLHHSFGQRNYWNVRTFAVAVAVSCWLGWVVRRVKAGACWRCDVAILQLQSIVCRLEVMLLSGSVSFANDHMCFRTKDRGTSWWWPGSPVLAPAPAPAPECNAMKIREGEEQMQLHFSVNFRIDSRQVT